MTKMMFQEVIVPILSYDMKDGKPVNERLRGTASFINSKGFFITAAHVILEEKTMGLLVKDNTNPENCIHIKIQEYESAPDGIDIAIGKTGYPTKSGFMVDSNLDLNHPTTVYTAGYPEEIVHIQEDGIKHIHLRNIKGYLQRIIPAKHLPTIINNPKSYELDFLVPHCMSGSPLMIVKEKNILIGICTGTSYTEYAGSEMVEIEENGKKYKEKTVKTIEYGMAIALDILQDWKPDLLEGKTLYEAIEAND